MVESTIEAEVIDNETRYIIKPDFDDQLKKYQVHFYHMWHMLILSKEKKQKLVAKLKAHGEEVHQ
jgi:hypothetical protein